MDEKYQAYLCSREWGLKREAVAERSGGICERCDRNEAYAVHHKTYARKYQEPLSDLIHLCKPCHEFTHGRRDYDPKPAPLLSLPDGNYMMQVIDSEVYHDNEEAILILIFEILGSEKQHLKFNLKIKQKNLDDQRLAERKLAEICMAMNIRDIADSKDFHSIKFVGYLKAGGIKRFGKYVEGSV